MATGGEKYFLIAIHLCTTRTAFQQYATSAGSRQGNGDYTLKEPNSYLTNYFETLLERFVPFLQDLKVHTVLCDRI